jgi:hypothetical protein
MTKHATLWVAIGAVCLVTVSAPAHAAPAAEANVYINTPGQNDQIVVQPGMQVAVVGESENHHVLSGFAANTNTTVKVDGDLVMPLNGDVKNYSFTVPAQLDGEGYWRGIMTRVNTSGNLGPGSYQVTGHAGTDWGQGALQGSDVHSHAFTVVEGGGGPPGGD